MRVAVVAELYPRDYDPVLGVWAHRQAVAAREAGADVRVLVLHRLVPPRSEGLRGLPRRLRHPLARELDGVPVTYVPFVSPPRGRTYGSWGAWAAPALARALRSVEVDLIHAHYAVPAGDAVRRAVGSARPLVVSNHGGDVFFTAARSRWVRPVYAGARLVLANSTGIAQASRELGARNVRVVRLGTDLPETVVRGDGRTVVTVGHLVARKGHARVIEALAQLGGLRYEVVGDGPERRRLEALARARGVEARFHGQLPHREALAVMRRADVLAMPSSDEAFGVAYVEAMAGGLPAIGRAGEPGPEDIASLGEGLLLAHDDDLAQTIELALRDRDRLGAAARATIERHLTWDRCGAATVAAYEEALG